MVTVKDTFRKAGNQGKSSGKKRQERAVLPVTADTPIGLCGESLSAFGGMPLLIKFLDLVGFGGIRVFDAPLPDGIS